MDPPAAARSPDEAWKSQYYREVILVDERRFLLSEALLHLKRLEPGAVMGGDKRVIIEDGKSLIHVPADVMEVWNSYVRRGENKGGV